jgi:hypothetical protein
MDMALFSRRKRPPAGTAPDVSGYPLFDFDSLELPPSRADRTLDVTVGGQSVPLQVSEHVTLADMAAQIAPMNPFLTLGPDGGPVALVRLEGLDEADVSTLTAAVRAGHSQLVPRYRSMPTYPVLALALAVYDRPDADAFVFEGFRDITTADVQRFLTALGKPDGGSGGTGTVYLYAPSPVGADLLASGDFTVRLPPRPERWQAHTTSAEELRQLWQVVVLGSIWLRDLPESKRDFGTAVDDYVKGGY